MIAPPVLCGGQMSRAEGEELVAAYERLRSHAFVASPAAGHYGLVVLLREGLAAWMTRGTPSSGAQSTGSERPNPAWVADDEVHGAMVAVLANMALCRHQEICT